MVDGQVEQRPSFRSAPLASVVPHTRQDMTVTRRRVPSDF
jgi:hypothetical protein